MMRAKKIVLAMIFTMALSLFTSASWASDDKDLLVVRGDFDNIEGILRDLDFRVLDEKFGAASPSPDTDVTPPAPILPVKLELAMASAHVEIGKTKDILVTFTPADATELDLVWTMSSPGRIEVTKSSSDWYIVKGLATGSTRLTATSKADSAVWDYIDVTVIGVSAHRPPNDESDDDNGCDSFSLGAVALLALAGLVARKK